MELEQAIAYAIQQEGSEIVNEKRFVNYLHDLGAFQQPAMRRIMCVMVEGGYCMKLLDSISNNTLNLVVKDLQLRLVQIEGLHEGMVSDAISAFCTALGYPNYSSTTEKLSSQNPITQHSSQDSIFKANQKGDNYEVELNGKTYLLNSRQYKSILRKKNSPVHILESWLKSYSV